MMYIPRASLLEASPVQLGDSKLFVVSIDGTPEVVSADSFNRLFRPAEPAHEEEDEKVEDVPHPWSKKGKAAKPRAIAAPKEKAKAVEAKPAASPAGEAETDLSTTDAIFVAVKEEARTQAETQDRACVILGWPIQEKKYRDRVYQAIWVALKTGKLEKRTDPSTQLAKLYIPGGAK